MNTNQAFTADNNTDGIPGTWIFQANPNRYRIQESLRVEQEEYWNLNQHAKDIRAGDRVLIWISGERAGIYAVGTVLTSPVVRSDSVIGIGYWIDPAEGKRAKARVLVRYDQVMLSQPLLKAFLMADPQLWDLRILHAPQGTNFPVSEEQWQAVKAWLDDRHPKEVKE